MSFNNKIVITDDEEMVLKSLKVLFELEGYSDVYCFDKPKDALDFLSENEVGLILSDFIMPEMNGIEFLSEAKKKSPNSTQILLTGYADKENAIKAINELGIYKYIEKPWDNTELLINVKNGLERSNLKEEVEQKIKELQDMNATLEETVQERTKELHQTNVKLATIIKDCADGIAIFNENHEILLANNALLELFGLNEESILLKNFFELIVNEKNQKFEEPLKERKTVYLRDFSLVNYKMEKKIPIEVNISSVNDSENNFYIASIRDVSIQAENEILRNDFIATLTHDLRTPLLAAISGLEFILNKSLGDVTQKQAIMLDTMKRSNQDMLGLVNALLEVYRYESGNLFLSKTKFCLNKLIKECVEELDPLIVEKQTVVELDLIQERSFFEINADRHEIKRVIMNLLGNALQHSPSNGEIKVTVSIEDKNVTVSVRDSGPGLDEEDCAKLFKRFSQGTSRKRACSTGLGLYLSRQIVEAHNGRIWVESKLGHGSKFSFTLKNAITENRVLL